MSVEIAGFKPGVYKADEAMTDHQFRCVKIASAFGLEKSGDGELSLGLLQNKPVLGEACEVDLDGVSKAEAGAAFAVGAKLASNASGKLITAASGKHVVAVANEAAGADGDICSVKIVGLAGQLLA